MSSRLKNTVQCLGKPVHGTFDVMQFVQPEQSDAEGLEIRGLVALKRNAGRDLQAGIRKLLAGTDAVIVRVADHHARRLETIGCHALETFLGQQ